MPWVATRHQKNDDSPSAAMIDPAMIGPSTAPTPVDAQRRPAGSHRRAGRRPVERVRQQQRVEREGQPAEHEHHRQHHEVAFRSEAERGAHRRCADGDHEDHTTTWQPIRRPTDRPLEHQRTDRREREEQCRLARAEPGAGGVHRAQAEQDPVGCTGEHHPDQTGRSDVCQFAQAHARRDTHGRRVGRRGQCDRHERHRHEDRCDDEQSVAARIAGGDQELTRARAHPSTRSCRQRACDHGCAASTHR